MADEKLKQGEIVTDGDELLIVDKVPTLLDKTYEVSSFESVEDLVDDSGTTTATITGTRSMGGAVGTTHKDDNV